MAPIPKSIVRAQQSAITLPKYVFKDATLAAETPPEYVDLGRGKQNLDGSYAEDGPVDTHRFRLHYQDGTRIAVVEKHNPKTQDRRLSLQPNSFDFDGDGKADGAEFEFELSAQGRKKSLSNVHMYSSANRVWYLLDKSDKETPTELSFGLKLIESENKDADTGKKLSFRGLLRHYQVDAKSEDTMTIPTTTEGLKEWVLPK
jgi:hypothetical protein